MIVKEPPRPRWPLISLLDETEPPGPASHGAASASAGPGPATEASVESKASQSGQSSGSQAGHRDSTRKNTTKAPPASGPVTWARAKAAAAGTTPKQVLSVSRPEPPNSRQCVLNPRGYAAPAGALVVADRILQVTDRDTTS